MKVPGYDNFQASPNALPQTRLTVPDMPDVAGQQTQQMAKGMQQIGAVMMRVDADMQNEANKLRVDDALNKAQIEADRLAFDKEAGFTNLRGENALKRPNGKPLADEYGETLQASIGKISADLGNDSQRQLFAARSNNLVTSFKRQAIQHETREHNVWADGVDENTVKLRMSDIGKNFNSPGVVSAAINGTEDDQGNRTPGIRDAIESMAKRNGKPKEWVDTVVSGLVSDAHNSVVLRLMDQSPSVAKQYLDDNMDAAGEHGPVLQKSLRVAVDREQGNLKGETIFKQGAPFGSTFEAIVPKVMQIEGGYVENDAGKGETNLGINKTANPDVDIKNLTPEKAKAIYKERYWNGIGADSLPPEMRAIAFDAAVNHGVSKANKMIAEANGDPKKLIELRRAEYDRLITENPGKFGQYEKSWSNRLDQLSAGLNGERSKSAMLDEANKIADPEQRNIAISRVTHLTQVEELAKKESYDNNLKSAQDIAFAKPGGWSDIAPTSWAQLKPEDREKLRAGLPKHSDSSTLLMLQENPDLWKAGEIEKYRSLLSESDYRNFHSKANGQMAEQKILQAKIDAEQFASGLASAGLEPLLNAKKGSKEEVEKIDLKAKFEKVIEAEQQAKGKSLTIDEKNALLTRLLKPVKVEMVRTGSWFGMFDGPSTPEDRRAYQVKNPQNINIPVASRTAILADFEKRGIKATPDRILNAYLAREEAKQ